MTRVQDVAEKRQLVLRKDQKYNSDQPRRSSRIKAATAAKQEYTAALRAHKEREEDLNERYSELLEEEWEENQRYSDWESGRVASEERTLEWKKPTKEKYEADSAACERFVDDFLQSFDRVGESKDSVREEKARWAEVETRLKHGKALYEAAE